MQMIYFVFVPFKKESGLNHVLLISQSHQKILFAFLPIKHRREFENNKLKDESL